MAKVPTTDLPLVRRFMALFEGYARAHGRYLVQLVEEDGKAGGRPQTVRGAPDEATFAEHLGGGGVPILGVVPIREDNSCLFGAVDVDTRGPARLSETLEALERRVEEAGLPLVTCRSKSGGAHLYLFASEPVPAATMQARLREFAAALGYGGSEVFPKQTSRANENDFGNWINLCYYGAYEEGGCRDRYALRGGERLDLAGFLDHAEARRTSRAELGEVKLKAGADFADGPPCLQHLASLGFSKGGRNTCLTNIGVYFQRKDPDNWQSLVETYNHQHFDPPLPSTEVSQILKNLTRKTYFYTCQQSPLSLHCDKKACAKRDYGIGNSAEYAGEVFPLENLTQYRSRGSVRWCGEYQGLRVELTTEELLSPDSMQRIFLERFCIMVRPAKKGKWHEKINELLRSVSVVDDPEDASREGQFEKMLDNFLTQSPLASTKDELLKGNCWLDGEKKRVVLRSEDLLSYLTVKRFQCTPQEVWKWLDKLGAGHGQLKVKGKMLRVWTVPPPQQYDAAPMALPEEPL